MVRKSRRGKRRMSELEKQIKAYEAAEQELVKLHKGKAVIFAEGALQGVFDDTGSAAHEAIKKFQPGSFLIRVVGDNVLPAKFYLRVA